MSVLSNIKDGNKDLINLLEQELIKVRKTITNRTRTKFAGVRNIIEDVLDLNGKMIRPLFVLLSANFGTYESDKIVNLASSVEMLHLATLIHDDIVDDAKVRRHRESAQSKYGKDMAVYAGDYLLSKSLTILNADDYDAKHVDRLAKGIERICESELLQYQSRFNTMTLKNYLRIVSGKTATLFAVSLYVGASESKCGDKLSGQLGKIGYELGIAFQIIDDILDFSDDQLKVGKSIQNDLKKGYFTLPVIYAIEGSKHNTDDILNASDMFELIDLNYGIERSRELARKYTKKAFKRINTLPEGDAKELLEKIATQMLLRKY